MSNEEDEGFKVHLRLHWSKGLWWAYRRFIPRQIILGADEVRARVMASFNHPSVPSSRC